MNSAIGIIFANYTSDRLKSLVDSRAIASIPFGGRYRLVDFPLSNMVNAGIKMLGLIAPYTYRSLADHIGNGKEWGIGHKSGRLFLLPGSVYGMRAGYTKFLMRDLLQNKSFVAHDNVDYVVLSATGFVYNMDYNAVIDFHKANKEPVTLVYKDIARAQRGHFLQVDANGKVTGIDYEDNGSGKRFLECMVVDRQFLIDFMGWYGALDYMDIVDLIREHLAEIAANAYEFKGYVRCIDCVEDYMQASMDLLKTEVRTELFENERPIFTNVQDRPPTSYAATAKVKNSLISAGSVIKGTVENSIIFRSVTIEKGAVVKNSILMQYASVAEGAELNNVICDKYVKIGEGRKIESTDEPILIAEDKNF